jgi:hypothetical protein
MSAALENTLATIAIAQSVAINLEAIYKTRAKNKTVLAMCKSLHFACNNAFSHWPGQLRAGTINRIAKRLERLEASVGWGQDIDIAVYTSTSLALLEDLRGHLAPYRQKSIDRIISAMRRVHRYFDQRMDKDSAYDLADRAVREWAAN